MGCRHVGNCEYKNHESYVEAQVELGSEHLHWRLGRAAESVLLRQNTEDYMMYKEEKFVSS